MHILSIVTQMNERMGRIEDNLQLQVIKDLLLRLRQKSKSCASEYILQTRRRHYLIACICVLSTANPTPRE